MSTDVRLEGLENLETVAVQPSRPPGSPLVSERVLALVCGPTDDASGWAVPADEPARAELVESGWFTAQGHPSARTQELRRDFSLSRTWLELGATDADGQRRGWICAGVRQAVVAIEAAPLPPSADPSTTPRGAMTLDVVPVSALPIVFARWGELAPAWNYDTAHEVSDIGAVEARLTDGQTPPPQDADEGLRELWSRPWTRWGIRCAELGVQAEFLAIAGAGQYIVRRHTTGATMLAPRPGGLVWGDLQKVVAGLPGQAPMGEDDVPAW